MIARALLVLLVASTTSCSLITSLDDLQGTCDVDLTLVEYGFHSPGYFELQVVDENDGLQARAILDPPGMDHFRIHLPDAVPAGTLRLEFAGDVHGDKLIDNIDDHRWTIPNACAETPHRFTHVGDFTTYTATTSLGGDFSITLSGMKVTNQALEVQVRAIVDERGGDPITRTVGLFRTSQLTAADLTVTIPGIVAPGVELLVSIWSDDNGNGLYDLPPADESWRKRVPASNASAATFTYVGEFVDIGQAMVERFDPGA